MTPKELMRVIVQTEQEARDIYDEALQRQDGFEAGLEAEKKQLREDIFANAESEVKKAQRDAAEKADAEIARLDERLAYEMNRAKLLFESNETALMERIFRIVVGLDE